MFQATRLFGKVLLVAAAGGGLVFCGGGTAMGQPVLQVGPEQIRVSFDGISGEPRSGGGLNLSLVKVGPIVSSTGRAMGDGSVCPQADRLTPSGVTLVCASDSSLLEWYKKVLAGSTERKSGSIIYLDREGGEVLRTYNLYDCFPTQIRKYESGDCDDGNPDLIQVELSVAAIGISGKKGAYVGGKFGLELDGCVVGGACPGTSQDGVSGLEIDLDAACLEPGGQPGSLKSATSFAVLLGGDDDCDGICGLVLQLQGKPVPPLPMKATVNTSRSNIKHQQRAADPPPTVLNVEGARIRSVTFPTFQVVPKAPPTDPKVIEKIEIAVEKVERA